MRYLSGSDILEIHSMIIDETGGLHGVRDRETMLLLEGLPRQVVFGKELYETPFKKAAVYARTIIMNHPFLDGNKRTGMSSAIVFLEDNGYVFQAKEGELQKFAVSVVTKRRGIDVIAKWLEKRVK